MDDSEMFEFFVIAACIAQATLSVLITVLVMKSEYRYRHLVNVLQHKDAHSEAKKSLTARAVHDDQMTLWCECNEPHEHHEPIGG